MFGRRQRLAIGAVLTVAALIAGGVLIDRFVLQAEWWQVDRSETLAAAPPLTPLGPPPGPVVTSWQLSTPVHHSGLPPYDQVAHAILEGQLIVVSGHGLSVRDARTGQDRWHYYRDGWSLLGWAATGARLVVYQERDGQRNDRLLLGFDAVSGRELWRQSGAVPAATERTTLRWPAGSNVVLTTDGERTSLHGRSAETGHRLWTKSLPRDCVLPEAAGYASDGADALTAVALDCGDRSRVLAVDPLTGGTRLNTSYAAVDPPEVVVRGDAVAVFDGSALHVYRRGKELLSRAGDRAGGEVCTIMCPVAGDDGRLIMVYRADSRKSRRMEAVELSSGRTLWQRDAPEYAAMTVSGGRLYALRPDLAENLLPAGIDIVDLAGGAERTVPVPVVLGPRRDVVRPWLGTGGGLLYVSVPEAAPRPFGAARLVALRGAGDGPGPPELGGVAAADWPDACELLHERDLDLAESPHRGEDYRPRPEFARIGDVRLSSAVSCTYEPPGGEQSAATPRVTVEWVADTPGTAAGLLAALRATQARTRDVPGIGDEAYELGVPSGTIAVRVDRYIVAVNAFQAPGLATRLARSAAAHLRAP